MVVAAYGLILPQWVLDLPPLGCLNIHASLLPRWRGAAPIHRAVEAGDARTGITLMQMDAGLDTGDMLLLAPEDVRPDDSTGSLHDRLALLGARLVVEGLARLALLGDGRGLPHTPQPAQGVSYAHKISKAEGVINWTEPAAQIERRLRAFDPFPGAGFGLDGEAVKLWRARLRPEVCGKPGEVLRAQGGELTVACGEGGLDLLVLQRPGGRRLDVATFLQSLQGRPAWVGRVLGAAGN